MPAIWNIFCNTNHNQLMPHLSIKSSYDQRMDQSIVNKSGLNLTNALMNEITRTPSLSSDPYLGNQSNAMMDESIDFTTNWSQRCLESSDGRNVSQMTRLYNSCPSSPRFKRFNGFNEQSFVSDMKCEDVITFDGLHGKDVILSADRTQVYRREDNCLSANCYAFIGHELRFGFDITVEIISVDNLDPICKQMPRSTIFGITDCRPSKLNETDLPDDPHLLVAKTDQMWTLVDNFCDNCCLNDKLTFRVDDKGFVSFSHNFNAFSILFPIPKRNQTENLWPLFNLIGRIKALRVINTFCRNIEPKMQLNTNLLKPNSNALTKHLYKCINCLSNYANTAFYRCGHKYYCYNCAKICFNSYKTCPFCYQTIFDLIIIFP